jgi:hypothetical protein
MHQNDLKILKKILIWSKKNKNFSNFFKNIFETQKQIENWLIKFNLNNYFLKWLRNAKLNSSSH